MERLETISRLEELASAVYSTGDLTASRVGFGLVRSHPYRDGNKRIAFLALAIFLGRNGYEIDAPEAEVVTVFVNLAAGRTSEKALAKWIRGHIVPLSSR